MFAVMISFRKSNRISVQRRTGAYRSRRSIRNNDAEWFYYMEDHHHRESSPTVFTSQKYKKLHI